ncbi:serine protease easter-like [Condylostylus longicornis]|uniref:serine protease easter-like n=1 Tax=Condylostylus longicornis TaxID=2530218 RepID=UPI00244DE994|nr:serine protease easter-like [Condylostylus longicornis]
MSTEMSFFQPNCFLSLFLILTIFQAFNCQIIFPSDDTPKPAITTLVRAVNYRECIGPNSIQGFCVKIHQCQDVWKSIREESYYKLSLDLILSRKRECGDIDTSLVCCDPNQIEIEESTETSADIPNTSTTTSSINKELRTKLPLSKIDLLPQGPQCYIDTNWRIFGGTETKLGEFPWLALIEYEKKNEDPGHHCGGSLINDRYVLTAAHCVKKINKDWRLNTVRLGEHDIETNPDCVIDINKNKECAPVHVDVTIEKAIVHENYNASSKTQSNDIALLRLSKPINYTKYIRPICLPISSNLQELNLNGISMAISGWGRTETGYASTKKLKAKVDVVSLSSCNIVYSEYNVALNDRQICAGGSKGVDTCNGDSGGPLVGIDTSTKQHSFYLAGIVSFGPSPCGLEGWPGVYTKTVPYLNWILERLEP